MNFGDFRGVYPAIPPKRAPRDPDECVQMTLADGMRFLAGPVREPVTIVRVPTTQEETLVGRYLWVIGPTDCPHGLEEGPFGQARRLGQVKHTNLTGGGNAHCGGELWYLTDDRVLINGASGRYGPATEQQLHDAARCLQALGYSVGYMRFGESNKPMTFAAGEEDVVWL